MSVSRTTVGNTSTPTVQHHIGTVRRRPPPSMHISCRDSRARGMVGPALSVLCSVVVPLIYRLMV